MINLPSTTKKRLKTTLKTQPEAYRFSDLGTEETQKRGITVSVNEKGEKVAKVRTQQPIDYYYNRGYIDDKQYKVANRLKGDCDLAGLGSYIKSSANFEVNGGNNRFSDEQIDAKKRYHSALACLNESDRKLVQHIVLDDGYLKDFKQHSSPAVGVIYAGIMESLADALDQLDRFYSKLKDE